MKAMRDMLGTSFAGRSNTYLAYKHDLEAIGTNAHELPMALAALADNDEELKTAQYRLLELWQQTYQGELLILLPDTFGTTQFLEGAPDWVADWTGQRMDSKDPFVAGDEYIAWLEQRGRDPRAEAADCIGCAGCGCRSLGCMLTFGGTLEWRVAWEFQRASDFLDREAMDSATAHPVQRGLGNFPDQRFSQLRSAGRRWL